MPPSADAAFFRGLLNAVPEATIAADPSGIILFANRAAEAMFGYGAGELAGSPVSSVLSDTAPASGIRRDGARFPVVFERPAAESLSPVSVIRIRDTAASEDRRFRWVLDS